VIPDLSVLWVIFFVLLLTAIVNSLIFKPLLRVMDARTGAIQKAKHMANEAAAKAQHASALYETKTSEARAEVYREMDAARKVALERRAELLSLTRKEADETRADAAARIQTAADSARAQISSDARSLSQAIVDRVLDRKAS
jgi:F0F1-type ATP synthase membrane subunit b/b'